MRVKCAYHLVAELKILRPELVIFHGAQIKWPVTNAIGKELEQIEVAGIGPVLYGWPVVGARLLFLHHPAHNALAGQWGAVVVPALDYLRAENLIPV
jgi:hypothetical protein